MKAHKLILSLSSPFFKNLFQDSNNHQYKILLPHYSTEVILSFVQFFYTGEIYINEAFLQEFISLCREFNCEQQIPVLMDLIKSHKAHSEPSSCKEYLTQEWFSEKSSSLSITRVADVPTKVEMELEFDEYFESNDNVETIFFNENEGNESGEMVDAGENARQEVKDIKEEYLNEEYIDEPQQFEVETNKSKEESETIDDKPEDEPVSERIHSKIEGVPNPNFLKNLQLAVDDVRKNGMSFWSAHKKYGITRSVIFRHVQKANEMQQLRKKQRAAAPSPSITFPALAMNINLRHLREEQIRFKTRLQEAINSCRDSNNSIKKASKMFDVPASAIERNLRGFKHLNPS